MDNPNFTEILQYAMRSQLAYAITQPAWDIAQQVGWRSPTSSQLFIYDVPAVEVNVIIEVDDTVPCQWIAVRGSSNLKNWLLNFDYVEHDITQTDSTGKTWNINLHKGFYQAAHTIYPVILPHLNKDYPTRITGHSLGGAIATILMMFLYKHNYHLQKCITFGQPKVTNEAGAKLCKALPLLRVINEQDIVPSLPPDTLLTHPKGGYRHFAPEIILKKESYMYNPQPLINDTDESFWNHLVNAAIATDVKDLSHNINNHYIENYLLNILNNMSSPDSNLQQLLQINSQSNKT